jgi:SAM-dependent methyltransferase
MTRGRFQGVRQILLFHWKMYLAAALGAVIAIAVAPRFGWVAGPALVWIVASIAVSHYVYDRSPLYGMDWLRGCLPQDPRAWVQLHAGLEETSGAITEMFPAASGKILDIFDPAEMTEPSIARARRVERISSPPANWRALPIDAGSCDVAFLIFTAHEFRRRTSREQFFGEVARALRANGDLIVVEHLRDWANFLAFGPGFLHFLPARAWRDAADAGGFAIRNCLRVTPFVRVFAMRRIA